MNQFPLAWVPYLICHFVGSRAAFGHELLHLESIDKLTPTTLAEQKQMVARRHVAVSTSFLLLFVSAVPG